MTFYENGCQRESLFWNFCSNWKANWKIPCVVNAKQSMEPSVVWTASGACCTVTVALWIITNSFHFTEYRGGMAIISLGRHCMTRATLYT